MKRLIPILALALTPLAASPATHADVASPARFTDAAGDV
jgi:hypothetical protein